MAALSKIPPPRIQSTGQFVSKSAYATLGIAGIVGMALLTVPFWQRLLISKSVLIDTEAALELPAIALKPSRIGALRVDIAANLPWGDTATYELHIRDQTGKVIASMVKDAWAETGTWAEDGETGTWTENEVAANLDLRAQQSETLTFVITLLEHTNSLGQELNRAVPFDVRVYSGAIDRRYLWAGLIGTLFTTLLAFWAVPTSGKRALSKTMPDNTVTDRVTLGGSDRLLRVVVKVKADPDAPAHFTLNLTLNNADGDPIFTDQISLSTNYVKSDGKTLSANANYTGFLVIATPGSYGFHAAVVPDDPIRKTTLTVYEAARTLIPVTVNHLS